MKGIIYYAVGAFFIGLGIVIMVFREQMSRVGRQTPAAANLLAGAFLVLVGVGAVLVALQQH